ncbi:hydroxyacylglutathione hydrolase [Quadrisphaera granulorum]|uniref:Hydroxyacylglutathione hydrolase n=1 Tax=Quadrisphaera granulorum TaxID=317664 RepID=A0A315ZSF8_9ACTN|nr:MBL fold metallo-hydrolase [Quadrisphaera granulorum]PWJ47870.1 hydroxyacylglutathione hydrolase [Quadrisphaera granulorum]SZE98637.1 hydroxyacylglutathione hydrolase [Quadrisphaera granulorum]
MLLERLYDEDLAQASYVIGCQKTGEAVVVDPRRDIADYLTLAAKHGLRITAVTETHIHADYLSGTRELAAATGATAYVSGEGGADWQYGFTAERLHDGDRLRIGNITLQARHTPGHTPEHLVFTVTDGAFTDTPGYLLSGDLVFAGDLGRPDLLDEAAGGVDTRYEGARELFASLKRVFLTLPDHVQVHPAHGSGSACGKALGAVASTTVGYERLYAWWSRYLADDDEAGFVAELLDGQPDAHAYFARMKRENREGPAVLGPLSPLERIEGEALRARLEADEAILIDTRDAAAVRAGSPAGALHIPGVDKAASYLAWVYDPETEHRPLVALAADAAAAEELRTHIVRVGVDALWGYTTSLDGLELAPAETIAPAELEGLVAATGAVVVDVRNRTEHAAGHVPGSVHLPGGRALWHTDELPAPASGTPVVTYCQSGMRNAVVASALRRAGHRVVQLEGSYAGWAAWERQQVAPAVVTARRT